MTLPATPKSSNGDKSEDSADQTGTLLEASGQEEAGIKDERADVVAGQDMEVDPHPEEKHFVLAPTPAQLGKAPLQRRLASSCSQDSSKDMSPTETTPPTTSTSFSGMFTSSVATATTTTVTTMEEPPPLSANSKKKQFFKKAKNDDMDT